MKPIIQQIDQDFVAYIVLINKLGNLVAEAYNEGHKKGMCQDWTSFLYSDSFKTRTDIILEYGKVLLDTIEKNNENS
jgi:hypothetical protein